MQNLFYKDTCCFLKKKGIYLKKKKKQVENKTDLFVFYHEPHPIYAVYGKFKDKRAKNI